MFHKQPHPVCRHCESMRRKQLPLLLPFRLSVCIALSRQCVRIRINHSRSGAPSTRGSEEQINDPFYVVFFGGRRAKCFMPRITAFPLDAAERHSELLMAGLET
ncbi:hypothetical protein AVEN_215501-1 [Araneus ventricosus]|uniref:Uncharacterized protein n=1 Tax=Araneus ventricosus TaxID=182803 RepID=A0A4Y2BH77_ARAVE|nr:hypothetical protein AVEN_215501-1 [Araneus ventricosus]